MKVIDKNCKNSSPPEHEASYQAHAEKENCHHDHIPFNEKGNGNIVFSVQVPNIKAINGSIQHMFPDICIMNYGFTDTIG